MSKKTLCYYIDNLSSLTKDLITSESPKEFDEFLDYWLYQARNELQTNADNLNPLDENGLTTVLAANLRTPEVLVKQEANSNGHVDITIETINLRSRWKRIGEAKIWGGNEYHKKGIDQLINRYSTGEDDRGLVISYVKLKEIKNKIEDLMQYMNEEKPIQMDGSCRKHKFKWTFLTSHLHDSGETIEVLHLGCNLYSKKAKKSI